jgi:hypothetical protein
MDDRPQLKPCLGELIEMAAGVLRIRHPRQDPVLDQAVQAV